MPFLKSSLSFFCALAFSLGSCFPKKGPKRLLINGAGASFPYILYSKWLSEYRKAEPAVAINYQSIGSGGGIRQFITGTLDFGGTDIPLSQQEILSSKKEILHIPTALGAVGITYNLKLEGEKRLRLDAEALSKIFRGKIKVWSDPELKRLNPGLRLPDQDIVAIYRADGSGTTSFFTEYLSSSSQDFAREVGQGKSVSWPVGAGGKGNEGVMGLVNKIEGAIAYIAAGYAQSQKLKMADLKNRAGRFAPPNLKSIQSAAEQAMKSGKSLSASLINMPGEDSYPLAGFTYIIISKKMPEKKGRALVKFLKWALDEGQKFAEPLYFAPLPKKAAQSALSQLSQAQFVKK